MGAHSPPRAKPWLHFLAQERKKKISYRDSKNVSGSQGLGRREGDPGKQRGITRGAVEGFGVVP